MNQTSAAAVLRPTTAWLLAMGGIVLFVLLLRLASWAISDSIAPLFEETARGEAARKIVTAGIASLLAVAVTLLLAVFATRHWAGFTLPKFTGVPQSAAGWIAPLVLVALFVGMMAFGPLRNSPFLEISVFNLGLSLVAACIPAVIEEIIFRGYLMDTLATGGVWRSTQVILSGLLFGLAHFSWGALGGENFNPAAAVGAMMSTTVLGMLLAGVYLISGRALLAPVLAHGLINLIIEPWLMLMVIERSKM